MGSLVSRRNAGSDVVDYGNNNAYRYPPKSGLLFLTILSVIFYLISPHFIQIHSTSIIALYMLLVSFYFHFSLREAINEKKKKCLPKF